MKDHSLTALIKKLNSSFSKEVLDYVQASHKPKTEKLYKLISNAKNESQLEKSLLFKKVFEKTYSEKNDYLWRNEIRILKEVLEDFLVEQTHKKYIKSNEAYQKWLLTNAYNDLQYFNGIHKYSEQLTEDADRDASYSFVLDTQFVAMENLQHIITDTAHQMEQFPEYIEQSILSLKNIFAANAAKINLFIAQYNWFCYNYSHPQKIAPIETYFTDRLVENPLSKYYNHYAKIFTNDFNTQIENFEKAIPEIESIAEKNLLYKKNSIIIQIALARELSTNGLYKKADTIFKKVKNEIDKCFPQLRAFFYINYITNLVKNQTYQEAIYTIDHEFNSDNLLYKNMLLQNRLLCYLYLKETTLLEKYISYDLDAAPFPQNYMLKIIKSAYFYLKKDYNTALNIINSLLNSKNVAQNMQLFQPIAGIYKLTYTLAKKNSAQKKWRTNDIATLKQACIDFEQSSTNDLKSISIYSWIKAEIEINIFYETNR